MTRALKHAEVPLDLRVRDHAHRKRRGAPPLIQTMFGMTPTDSRTRRLAGGSVDLLTFDHARGRTPSGGRRGAAAAHALSAGRLDRAGLCRCRASPCGPPGLIAGLLGIVKAGGAYLALDPGLPGARVREILADAGAAAGLARPGAEGRLMGLSGPVLAPTEAPETPPPGPASAGGGGAPAHVCHTSGSSGRPKGACVAHRGVLRLVTGATYVRLGPEERMLHPSSAGSDAATFEIWGALLNGATLVQPLEGLPSVNAPADLIGQADITALWLAAGLFQQMVDLRPDCFAGGGRCWRAATCGRSTMWSGSSRRRRIRPSSTAAADREHCLFNHMPHHGRADRGRRAALSHRRPGAATP